MSRFAPVSSAVPKSMTLMLAVGGDEEVLGLEVAVRDAVLVQVLQRGRELAAPVERDRHRHAAAHLAQALAEVVAVDVLEHEVRLGAVLGPVEAAHDAGMVERPRDLHLALEPLEDRGIGEEVGMRELEHDETTRALVARLVRLGVRALAELFENLEVVDGGSRGETHQERRREKRDRRDRRRDRLVARHLHHEQPSRYQQISRLIAVSTRCSASSLACRKVVPSSPTASAISGAGDDVPEAVAAQQEHVTGV